MLSAGECHVIYVPVCPPPYLVPTDLMTFDEMSSSEKLSHLTAHRPKRPGRRLPGQFGGGPSVSAHEHRGPSRPLTLPDAHMIHGDEHPGSFK